MKRKKDECKRCGRKIEVLRYPDEEKDRTICDRCFLKDVDKYIDETLMKMEMS